MYIERSPHGLPDPAVMALHRGRIDLAQRTRSRDPGDSSLLESSTSPTSSLAPAYSRDPRAYTPPEGTPVHGHAPPASPRFRRAGIAGWFARSGHGSNARRRTILQTLTCGGQRALLHGRRNTAWVSYGRGLAGRKRVSRLLLDRGAEPEHPGIVTRGTASGRRDTGADRFARIPRRDAARRLRGRTSPRERIFVSRKSLQLIEAAWRRPLNGASARPVRCHQLVSGWFTCLRVHHDFAARRSRCRAAGAQCISRLSVGPRPRVAKPS
jgi:hypothetical protein